LTRAQPDRWLGRSDLEWVLLSLWVALLGIQLPVDLPNFRFSPADVVLLLLLLVLLVRRPRMLVRAAMLRTPVHAALVCLFVALAWGSAVAFLRTGTLVREALLNKDLGFFILVAIVVAIRACVRTIEDVKAFLRVFLVSGTVVTWIAAASDLFVPLAIGLPPTQRFDGFLLNPSANAVFVAVILMIQIGSLVGGGIVKWPRSLQYANAFGLALLLLLTLSRSTWLAALGSLVLLTFVVLRDRPWLPVSIAIVLAVLSAQPLTAAMAPVIAQFTQGRVGVFEREVAPSSTPPPDIGAILDRPPRPSPVPPTPEPSRTPPSTPRAVTSPPSAATPSGAQSRTDPATTVPPGPDPAKGTARYLTDVQAIGADRFGGTDRVAFDVVALRLWLAGPLTALTGIGIGVFFLVSPVLFGTAVIIHSTYVWLAVEMGVAGIVALVALLVVAGRIVRGVTRPGVDRAVAVSVAGPLFVFFIWIAENEGLYQRTLWLTLALGSVLLSLRENDRGTEA
jgi:hypothetical protein